jgi:uncharacterized protein YkwD
MQASSLSPSQLADASLRSTFTVTTTPPALSLTPATRTVTPTATTTPPTATPPLTATVTPTPLLPIQLLAAGCPGATPTPGALETSAPTALPSPTCTPAPAATGTPSATATATPSPPAGASNGSIASDFLGLLNAERARNGLGPLSMNPNLSTAATNYARYMATANFFGHDGPDGSSPVRRVDATGYPGTWRGETLAAGQASAALAFDVWWNQSPPHHAILSDPTATEIGVGYYFGGSSFYGHYWVVETGHP